MSLAEETRRAVRSYPFLYEALRAGVLNYTATARFLDLGEVETVTAALRRYGEELDTEKQEIVTDVQVRMQSGLECQSDSGNALLSVGDRAYGPASGGSLTGIIVSGDLTQSVLAEVLDQCRIKEITIESAAVCEETLVAVTDQRDGPTVLRIVEDVL